MWKCNKCNQYRWSTVDKCECKEFKIIDEDEEEHSIYAMDEHDAALKYAEKSNIDGDYYLMDESVSIQIGDKTFSIGAEPDIHYSATETD
jgi:hypothetical protein